MKKKNLQPWLDYFDMLQTYIQGGFLEMLPAANEAYITEPALYNLGYADELLDKMKDALGNQAKMAHLKAELWKRFKTVAYDLRTYSNFLNAAADGYKTYARSSEKAPDTPGTKTASRQADENLRKPNKITSSGKPSMTNGNCFALHVVSPQHPNSLKFTILVVRRRRWYSPWKITDFYDVIYYNENEIKKTTIHHRATSCI